MTMRKEEHEKLVRSLPTMDDASYWALFERLYTESPREYLVTLLRGIGSRDPLESEVFQRLSHVFSEIDRQKVIKRLMSRYQEPESLRRLFLMLGYGEAKDWLPFLLNAESKAAAFLLLQSLRYVEDDRELLMRVARFLLRRGDALAYNVASIMRLSFGLDALRGTFSLQLQPWQLAKMEQDWSYFSSQMLRE